MDEPRTGRRDPAGFALGAALLASVLAVACGSTADEAAAGEVTGPAMRPGQDCLRCHEQDSEVGAPEWFAAGTIFPHKDAAADEGVAGVKIILTGADGVVTELTSNPVGNFYTPVPIAKPFRVAIEHEGKRREMPFAPPSGGCNACHSAVPIGGSEGRLYLPEAHPSRATCDGDQLVLPTDDGIYDCAPYTCASEPEAHCTGD
jgi:hypothetical protein